MEKLKFGCVTVAAVIGSFLGGWDKMLQVLFTLTVLDVVTGVVLAASRGELNNNDAWNGFAKKIGIYVMVGVAVALDSLFGSDHNLRGMIIGFFIGSEGLSIVENWARFGLPLPEKFKEILKDMSREKSDTE